jgi:hypothetical protein
LSKFDEKKYERKSKQKKSQQKGWKGAWLNKKIVLRGFEN